MMSFVKVILPLKLTWYPWYKAETDLRRGQRILVEFAGRDYIGIVEQSGAQPDCDESKILPVKSFTNLPDISEEEFKLWEFIASYYLCTVGDVFKAAQPTNQIKVELNGVKKKPLDIPCSDILLSAEAPKPELYISSERYGYYREKIRQTLSTGRQVLVLSPDFIFCDYLERKLKRDFKDCLHVVNSRQTPKSKRETAFALRQRKPIVVLGTRSAIFLPFANLGLVITDEEQDNFYKQDEPNPRYQGRDCAIVLASIHRAAAILGTECPSLESYANYLAGKYSLKRGTVELEGMEVIDIKAEKRKGGMHRFLSYKFCEAAKACEGKVALIRGWENQEELAEEIATVLPGTDVKVMTLTESRKKDLQEYGLVGIIQADALVQNEDFRADEKSLQIIVQLDARTRMLIVQTAVPERFDGSKTLESLLEERKAFNFPPFSRIVDIKTPKGIILDRKFIAKTPAGTREKAAIPSSVKAGLLIDVDPQ